MFFFVESVDANFSPTCPHHVVPSLCGQFWGERHAAVPTSPPHRLFPLHLPYCVLFNPGRLWPSRLPGGIRPLRAVHANRSESSLSWLAFAVPVATPCCLESGGVCWSPHPLRPLRLNQCFVSLSTACVLASPAGHHRFSRAPAHCPLSRSPDNGCVPRLPLQHRLPVGLPYALTAIRDHRSLSVPVIDCSVSLDLWSLSPPNASSAFLYLLLLPPLVSLPGPVIHCLDP